MRLASYRARSEDRAVVIERGACLVVLVADGAGGIAGGGLASERVIGQLREHATAIDTDVYDLRAWTRVITALDRELALAAGGETTVVVAVVGPDAVAGVSAGDSEAWVVGSDRVDRLTAGQARARIGSGHVRPVAFHRPQLLGRLLVASDGLFRHASTEAIVAAVASGERDAAADALIELPRSGTLPDDVAVVLVEPSSGG